MVVCVKRSGMCGVASGVRRRCSKGVSKTLIFVWSNIVKKPISFSALLCEASNHPLCFCIMKGTYYYSLLIYDTEFLLFDSSFFTGYQPASGYP